jgi:dimeric dUTPase (all-alpha-NTP-PPase superfamily)
MSRLEHCDVCKESVSQAKTVCNNCISHLQDHLQAASKSDMLRTIYERQKSIAPQMHGVAGWAEYSDVAPTDKKIHLLCVAIMHEAAELDRLTNWKWWKRSTKQFDQQEAREELVDIVHFVLQAAIELGMTPEEIMAQYMSKSNVNVERQRSGY